MNFEIKDIISLLLSFFSIVITVILWRVQQKSQMKNFSKQEEEIKSKSLSTKNVYEVILSFGKFNTRLFIKKNKTTSNKFI